MWGWEFSIESSGVGDKDCLKTAFVLGYRACLVFLASVPVSCAIAWGFGITSASSNRSCASDTSFGTGVFGDRRAIS